MKCYISYDFKSGSLLVPKQELIQFPIGEKNNFRFPNLPAEMGK